MSGYDVTINGITYTASTRRPYGAPDYDLARRTLAAPIGSAERAEGMAHFEREYGVRALHGPNSPERDAALAALAARHGAVHTPGSEAEVRRRTFQIVRSLANRTRNLEARRVEADAARRAADCLRFGCCTPK